VCYLFVPSNRKDGDVSEVSSPTAWHILPIVLSDRKQDSEGAGFFADILIGANRSQEQVRPTPITHSHHPLTHAPP
jgi:hypothetical protein